MQCIDIAFILQLGLLLYNPDVHNFFLYFNNMTFLSCVRLYHINSLQTSFDIELNHYVVDQNDIYIIGSLTF